MNRFSLVSYLLPRIEHVVFLIIFAAALMSGPRLLNADGDLPRHLKMGEVILESGTVPQMEIFSYVYEGRPYVAHEWLAGVIFSLCYKILGLQGVVLLTAILASFPFFFVYRALAREYEERLLMAVFVLWGAANTFMHWIARPHMFTVFFLGIWLVLIHRISRGNEKILWIPPLLMVLWGNIHAEFVAGFLVLFAYMAGWFWGFLFDRQNTIYKVIRNLAVTFLFCLFATLINPFGLQTWTTIFSYVGNSYLMSSIVETRPPDFTTPGFVVELILIIASILILALKRKPLDYGHAFLLAGFTTLAMTSGRNIHLYGVVAPFILTGPAIEITDSIIQRKMNLATSQIEKQLKGFFWPVAVVIVSWIALASRVIGTDHYFDPRLFPVKAVNWLEQNPQSGRMFNDFRWGGYIVWRLWPMQKDFIDSQTDTIGEATRLYKNVRDVESGWEEILEDYDIEWVIMPPQAVLAQELTENGWGILYQDTTAIILRNK